MQMTMRENRSLRPARLCRTMTGMEPIAHIHTDLPQKFGIPRNSFLAPHLQGRIVFEPEFASNAAVEAWTPSLTYGCSGASKTARPAARLKIWLC